MQSANATESRPDALADVPGICDLPLTRAVVQYRDVHELHHHGGRIRDIGLAVVVSGRFASSARAVDLGSAEVKYLNLATELVILDWVYDPTLAHLRALTEARGEHAGRRVQARRYCFDLALRVLERRGFTPLTRPILLRIGFRDLCKDLDLHEHTVVRIVTGPGVVTRVHLDYEANSLVFGTPARSGAHELRGALREAFAGVPVGRAGPGGREGWEVHDVRFGVPVTYDELLRSLRSMRRGLSRVVARFEPERFGTVSGLMATFGERATLDRLNPDSGGIGVVATEFDESDPAVH